MNLCFDTWSRVSEIVSLGSSFSAYAHEFCCIPLSEYQSRRCYHGESVDTRIPTIRLNMLSYDDVVFLIGKTSNMHRFSHYSTHTHKKSEMINLHWSLVRSILQVCMLANTASWKPTQGSPGSHLGRVLTRVSLIYQPSIGLMRQIPRKGLGMMMSVLDDKKTLATLCEILLNKLNDGVGRQWLHCTSEQQANGKNKKKSDTIGEESRWLSKYPRSYYY